MMRKYPASKRGVNDKGWLQSYHTFSFDTFYDPEQMGYRSLRVLNEDRIQGAKGFGEQMHKEIEIATLVLEGALEHRDNLGNTTLIKPGDLYLLSAGKGIIHNEYNLSHTLPVHFYQLWFTPEEHSLEPSFAHRQFSTASKWGQWCLLMSRNGRDGSIRGHQDVDLYATLLEARDEIRYQALNDRYYWVQVLSGKFKIGEIELSEGDALSLENGSEIIVHALEKGEILLFDFS